MAATSARREKVSLLAGQLARRGKAWLKVKPARTFELGALVAERGHGRRRGYLSNLHLGRGTPRRAGW